MRLLKLNEVQKMLLDLMKKVHVFLQDNNIDYYMLGGSALGAVRHDGFIPWDDDIDIGMLRDDYERFLAISNRFDSKYEVVNYQNSSNCDFCLTRIYIPNTFIDLPPIKDTILDTRLYFDIFPIDNVPDSKTELKKFESCIVKRKKLIARIDVRNYNNSKIKLLLKNAYSVLLKPQRNRILSKTDLLMKKYQNISTLRVCSLSSQYSFKKQVMFRDIYGKPTLHNFCDSAFFIPEKVDEYLTVLFGADYMDLPSEKKRRRPNKIYLLNEGEV